MKYIKLYEDIEWRYEEEEGVFELFGGSEISRTLSAEMEGFRKGWNGLMLSIYLGNHKKFRKELEKENNLEYTDRNGNTPLILASEQGELKMVKKLIEKGANINHKNYLGMDFYDVSKNKYLLKKGVKDYIEEKYPLFLQMKLYNL